MIVWVGVDPGARDTAGVLRSGSRLLSYVVKTSTAPPNQLPSTDYARDVVDWVLVEIDHARGLGHDVRIAVEGLVVPTFQHGQRSRVHPAAVMGVAIVFGYVMGAFPDAVVVRPGGHGSAPLSTYPKELVGARETKGTGGILRHARSAFDIAGAGARVERYPQLGA